MGRGIEKRKTGRRRRPFGEDRFKSKMGVERFEFKHPLS